jgi:hypothetical protein
MPPFDPRVTAGAIVGLGLMLALGLPAPVHAGEAVAAATVPETAAPQDYYTRRARETLQQDEKLNALAPHPLAAAYPRHSVVVCEAGCSRERGAEIVFMERIEQAAVQGAGGKTVAAAAMAGAAAKQTATIDCVGGCYDTPRRYEAAHMAGPPSARPGQAKLLNPNHEPFDPRY